MLMSSKSINYTPKIKTIIPVYIQKSKIKVEQFINVHSVDNDMSVQHSFG